ncbi:MAG: murein L,D-transpeptidase [Anaerolineae bacterium]|nr:MAG: murein L,D-transpeptidase [Anaerolineae bacterium]
MYRLSRRDFLKLGLASLGGLAFTPFYPQIGEFDDIRLVRVATDSVSVYKKPSDDSLIVGQWYRDEIIRVYEEVIAEEPAYNPVWYRVWGGYVHRGRLQPVNIIFNEPLPYIPEGQRLLAEVTVPYTQAMRYTKTYGWQPNLRLYYETVHWITAVDEGPDGTAWYRIFDELVGYPYHVPAIHMRPIPEEELTPISPDLPLDAKRIEVNLTKQILEAYEYDQVVFRTTVATGIPAKDMNTPVGTFNIDPKTPSKHMGDGRLFAGIEDYELPGVPWTCFFTEVGHAFHGTYWHDNFGTPMSHGCVNMRTPDAKWLYRWVRPPHKPGEIYNKGLGTQVIIHY